MVPNTSARSPPPTSSVCCKSGLVLSTSARFPPQMSFALYCICCVWRWSIVVLLPWPLEFLPMAQLAVDLAEVFCLAFILWNGTRWATQQLPWMLAHPAQDWTASCWWLSAVDRMGKAWCMPRHLGNVGHQATLKTPNSVFSHSKLQPSGLMWKYCRNLYLWNNHPDRQTHSNHQLVGPHPGYHDNKPSQEKDVVKLLIPVHRQKSVSCVWILTNWVACGRNGTVNPAYYRF